MAYPDNNTAVLSPVAPPSTPQQYSGGPDAMKESVKPAVPGVSSSVAQVTLEYPETFKSIVNNVNNASSPQARVALSDAVAKHNTETQEYRPNQKTQWDKVIVNVLGRNYNEALKWFNGGGVVEKEARDLNNEVFFREENDFGYTGRIKNREGKFLTPDQIKNLDQKGGIFTDTDKKALQTAPWVNGKNNQLLAEQGLRSQFQLATNDAYNAARLAGGANENIDQQLQLTTKLKPVLNYISTLPSERRQKILGVVNRLNQLTGSSGKTAETAMNVNASGQAVAGQTAGVSGGFGMQGAGEGGVPPPGSKLSAGGSMGASTSAGTQAGVSGREANIATSSQANMLQEQQTLQAALMQELQGVIKSPAEFQDFIRLQSLNAANDIAYKNIPEHVKPPTWNTVPDTDPYTGGADAMIANRVSQQRNNALMAAWSKELYTAQREQAKTGKSFDVDSLAQNFQQSDIFKAINNTFEHKMRSNIEGRVIRPPKGSLMVNNRNQIGLSPGD
jgi:hypothetical protein